MIVNVLMFKLKDRTAENIAAAREKLLSLGGNVPQLDSVVVESNIRPSAASSDLVMISKYRSQKDFDEYITHPYHVEVGTYIQDAAESITSVCFEE